MNPMNSTNQTVPLAPNQIVGRKRLVLYSVNG